MTDYLELQAQEHAQMRETISAGMLDAVCRKHSKVVLFGHRLDMAIIERADVIRKMIEGGYVTREQIANEVGVPSSTVYGWLRSADRIAKQMKAST